MSKISPLLSKLTKGKIVKHYPRNQIIFYQDDRPVEVAILSDGYIKVLDIDKQNNEKILHILRPGAVLPLSFLETEDPKINWFYAALTDCDIYMVDLEHMRTHLSENNELNLLLTYWFSMEVNELLVRLSSLGKSSARDKILAALKFLSIHSAKSKRGGWKRVNFPVNHQMLADMTGVTRESAATIMKDLSEKSCVRNPRQSILEINFQKLIS